MASDLFVERKFKIDGRDVGCRFFRPEEEEGSFFCRYEIDWPDRTRVKRHGGVDEIQALLLAMQSAHTELLAARENDERKVRWLDELSLGLPIASSFRDWDPDNRL